MTKPQASVDDDTGTQFLERLSMARGKIENKQRIFKTSDEREQYLVVMNNLYKKYAGLERKITQMTSKTWDTKRELGEIEQNIRATYDTKAHKGRSSGMKTLNGDSSKNSS